MTVAPGRHIISSVNRRLLIALQVLLVVAITIVAFYPTLSNGFTNWDDPELLLGNESIKSLSGSSLQAWFTHSYGGFGGYTPLVFLSYALEYRAAGLDPRAFHLDNLVLHCLNTVLVGALVLLISGNVWVGFLTALLFGVHPLHVEAVAWIPGRKDLLFSLFFLAAAISYLVHLRRQGRTSAFYALSLLFFCCSLLSKVAAVSFPLVALALESHERHILDRKTLRRLAPFLALAAVFLALAFVTMRSSPYGIPAPRIPRTYWQNLGLFFYAFVFYLSKIFMPLRLSPRYPADIGGYPADLLLNGVVFVLACAFLAIAYRRRRELARFGVAFFVFTILPTLPFHFAGQPYADRYVYLPAASVLAIVAAFLLDRPSGPVRSYRTRIAGTLGVLIVLLFGGLTWTSSRVWHDSLSLWTRVLRIDPRSPLALLNRGLAYSDAGELDSALADFDAGEKIDQANANFPLNRGAVYFKKGEYDKALRDFDRTLALDPNSELGYINRAILWGRLRQFPGAVQDCTKALEINPVSFRAFYYRGLAYKEMDAVDRALADFRAAYRISPSEEIRREIESLSRRRSSS